MTDRYIQSGFDEVYNGFWRECRNHMPEPDDEEGWDRSHNHALELQEKYPFLSEVIIRLEIELYERMKARMRKKENR
ncbi:hypothetical protein [Otoolea muris]|uniref:hypothetical protein n=1 Tax=Otoolea muris TaxID=2941515 RepID=UPI00203C7665|nr:hypothetical protein [Otoolea muris]